MCELCHQYKCPVSCPNFDDEEYAVYHCDECGCALISGDQAYKIGEKVYCEDCCKPFEVESSEPYENEDAVYEAYRDSLLEREWENA